MQEEYPLPQFAVEFPFPWSDFSVWFSDVWFALLPSSVYDPEGLLSCSHRISESRTPS